MVTQTFNNIFFDINGNATGFPFINNNVDFTIDFDGHLSLNETFQITVGPVTFDATFLGANAAGDIEFSFVFGGVTYTALLSDSNFSGPWPDFPLDDFTCFLVGTQIAIPGGERAVELLTIGDLILTSDGRAVPVKWVGRQTIPAMYGLSPPRSPVSIAAGAFGEGLPARELRVTADHALLLDGVLVQASTLVNGTTIRRIPSAELGSLLTVYHIETEKHETILAEGVPAETFIDNVSRRRFDNYAEYEALYGTVSEVMVELGQPRAMGKRQVPLAIRARIEERASALLGTSANAA